MHAAARSAARTRFTALLHDIDQDALGRAFDRPAAKARVVRYADDFVMGFESSADVERMLRDLPARLNQFLREEKIQPIELGAYRRFGAPSWGLLVQAAMLGSVRANPIGPATRPRPRRSCNLAAMFLFIDRRAARRASGCPD